MPDATKRLMTPEERDAARNRCYKATPPPWQVDVADYQGYPSTVVGATGATAFIQCKGRQSDIDAGFIIHARTDLPAALDHIELVEADLQSIKETHLHPCDGIDRIQKLEEEVELLRAGVVLQPYDLKCLRCGHDPLSHGGHTASACCHECNGFVIRGEDLHILIDDFGRLAYAFKRMTRYDNRD